MKSALKTLLRRLIALILMIGPFAVPAEAETVQDRLWSAINTQDATSLRVAVEQGAIPTCRTAKAACRSIACWCCRISC